jgi:hypothetical protein
MVNETLPPVEFLHLGLVNIQPDNVVAFTTKLKAQREADITKAHNGKGILHDGLKKTADRKQ